jgi:hypothetical protein
VSFFANILQQKDVLIMSVFAENEIKSIDGVDLEGKLIIMDPTCLKEKARDRKFQVHFAYYGSGCCPSIYMSGKRIFVYDLSDGGKYDYRRSDFIGYIEEEQLSLEQKVILVNVKKELKNFQS